MSTASLEPITMPRKPQPQPEESYIADFAARTALIRVSFGMFGNTRKVPTSQVEVDTDKSMIRVNKTLLDSKELVAINKADCELRRWLYGMVCLASGSGVYIVSIDAIPKIRERLQVYKNTERPKLIKDFLRTYPDLCKLSAERLRALGNAMEYPTVDEAEAEFTLTWRISGFGPPDSLKAIPGAYAEEVRKDEEERQEIWTEIRTTMRATMAQLVTHLRERLESEADGRPKVFRGTTVTNLMEFLENFKFRNATEDSELMAEVKKAKTLLNGLDADKIRESDSVREYVKKEMAKISDSLGKLVQDKPTRKIKDYLV